LVARANPSSSSDNPPMLLESPSSSSRHSQLHKRSKHSLSPGTTRSSRRAKRARPVSGFYGEDSDSQSSDAEQSKRPRTSPNKQSPARATKRQRGNLTAEDNPGIDNLVIPDWPSLPYLALVQIFQYAAEDLEDAVRALWLSAASRVCRAFAEPALTVLYREPPLPSRSAAHNLASLLTKDPSATLFNYRPKVEALYIDVEEIASKTYKGQPLDLKTLVGNLPRLKVLQFFHRKDAPPYRMLDDSLRWHYPAGLFEALNGTQAPPVMGSGPHRPKLFAWQWNRRLMGPNLDLSGIRALHQAPSFASLKKLSFVNYQVPSLNARRNVDDAELLARDRAMIQSLADAINALPALESLSVESSTAINDQLLPLLPKGLKTLELVNCWEVNGDDFASYLLSNAYKLEHLILRHNQSLNLSFVTVLGEACPNLRSFWMDFKTYNHHEFYHDSEPNYDDLLTADQVPNWPENLERLELRNMRKWTEAAAETLFQSLVDSAPKLLKLRQLVLKAMLDIPYRKRSAIRDKWEAELKRVFLRKSEDPRPVFSMRQQPASARLMQTGKNDETVESPSRKKARKSPASTAMAATSPTRRSSRIAMQLSGPSSRASSVGRDLRHGAGRPSYAEPDTDDDDEEEEEVDSPQSGKGREPTSPITSTVEATPFRHGMCEKVEIQLDNQKPAETTWGMEDFMDNEADDLSDEDWNGDDEEFGDFGYAW
jgi:hypothetical protein